MTAIDSEVRAWLSENWDPNLALATWRGRLADSGWGCPTWPVEWCGRGLPREAARIVSAAFADVGAMGPPSVGVGILMAAPMLLEHASSALKTRLIRPIVAGEERWSQLFSEPGSGSDLAGLTTRAERDGAEWVVNGQKVWVTGADKAHHSILLARTDWGVAKHRGITCFVLSMNQLGVDVRRLRQMNEHSSFSEVFLTDARIPHENIVGEVGNGWSIAQSVLASERAHVGAINLSPPVVTGTGRLEREAAIEMTEYLETYRWYPQRAGRPDLVVDHARSVGATANPVMRQRIAAHYSLVRLAAWNRQRAQDAQARGMRPGPEVSIAKLCATRIARVSAALHADLAGASGLLTGPDTPFDGMIAEVLVSVPAGSIAGGTDEIQRNIIGERVLGLPREPAVDLDSAFQDVRVNSDVPRS